MSVRYAVWLESPLGRGVLGDALPGGSDGEPIEMQKTASTV